MWASIFLCWKHSHRRRLACVRKIQFQNMTEEPNADWRWLSIFASKQNDLVYSVAFNAIYLPYTYRHENHIIFKTRKCTQPRHIREHRPVCCFASMSEDHRHSKIHSEMTIWCHPSSIIVTRSFMLRSAWTKQTNFAVVFFRLNRKKALKFCFRSNATDAYLTADTHARVQKFNYNWIIKMIDGNCDSTRFQMQTQCLISIIIIIIIIILVSAKFDFEFEMKLWMSSACLTHCLLRWPFGFH